jgi:hypothetical protein
MPIATVRTPRLDLVNALFNENSKYLTNKGSLGVLERIAQDPTESEERRAEALAKYERIKKEVEIGSKKVKKLKRDLDKFDGGKALSKIQEDIDDLNEQKNLLIDPEGVEADRIDEKIQELVKPFQKAYSKVVGAQISETVARTKLLGKKVSTFGAPKNEGTPPAKPQAVTETPTEVPTKGPAKETPKKPESTKPKVKAEATTRNPVTGEVIKVSDIKPATGETRQPVEVGPNALPPVDRTAAARSLAEKYELSEALFKNVDTLREIFEAYVNPKSKMTDDEFSRRVTNDVWFKKNSKGIKQRFVQYYNFLDMKESGQADGSTQYEQDIESIVRGLEKRATEIGSAAASDPIALRQAAENLYLTNKEKDTTFINDFLASSISAIGGTIGGKPTEGYSGQALKDYQTIQSIARSNGFSVKDIVPGGQSEQQVLQGIATGKIDPNRLAQDARKLAAQGQPQYVRDLLGQGYNLDQVYAPYRQTMANLLEINADQIDINDPTLRTAITDKGDMNVYDFKRTLKADKRWQYTENAKQEVSDAALKVLRDFGFQG